MNVLDRKFQFGAILLVAVMCAASFTVFFADESNAESEEFDQISYIEDAALTDENLDAMPYYTGASKSRMVRVVENFLEDLFGNVYDSDFSISDVEFSGKGKYSNGQRYVFDGKKSSEDSFFIAEDSEIKFKLTVNNTKKVFANKESFLLDDKYDIIKAIGFDTEWTAGDVYTGTLNIKYFQIGGFEGEYEKISDGKYFESKIYEKYGTSVVGKFTLDGIFGKGMTVSFNVSNYEGEENTHITEANIAELKVGDIVSTEKRLA